MNKNEKLIATLLGVLLAAYLGWQYFAPKPPAPVPAPVPVSQSVAAKPAQMAAPAAAPATADATSPANLLPAAQTAILENKDVRLTFSTHGATLVKAEMLAYKAENTDDAKHVIIETGDLLNLSWANAPVVPMTLKSRTDTALTYVGKVDGVDFERTVTLGKDYALDVTDTFRSAEAKTLAPYHLSVGGFRLNKEAGNLLSADTLADGESKPVYREGKLGKVLGAKSAFLGCGTSTEAAGLPAAGTENLPAPQTWIALKDRFFVTVLKPQVALPGALTVSRDLAAKVLTPDCVSAAFDVPAVVLAANTPVQSTARLYVGPKKLSCLKAFGDHTRRIMDFGFFTWFCELLLPLLNFFNMLIPNYGIAIILLTLVVRIVFWPLTHKSTVSMRKMSVVQPLIKEIQAKYKDNPQKIQQETLQLYRQYKVNPFSSCLPMLIQIPIFIALFTVLRSAVELRFAGFLWIADLSQPENLLAGILPVPLNILPILTALTMGLQTHLSPGAGDPAQKKMMTWMMPAMLLFMFYSMPSALCLYWTVSQVLSIVQMIWIRKTTGDGAVPPPPGKDAVVTVQAK